MPEPVRIQVGIELAKPIPVADSFLREIITAWADGGARALPRGIKLKWIKWINPQRRNLRLATWKDSRDSGQTLGAARKTLRGLLRNAPFTTEDLTKVVREHPSEPAKDWREKAAKKGWRKRKRATANKKRTAKRKLRKVRKGKRVRK